MALRWTATDQIANTRGIKCLVYGGPGVGKTVLCSTAPDPLIISAESGMLSLRRVSIPALEVSSLEELTEAYKFISTSAEMKRFQTVCVDSLSEIAEVILSNAKARAKDPRQAYGEVIEQTVKLIRAFRDTLHKNIYMTAKMEPIKDEMTGVVKWGPSMPGSKLGPQIPYYFDEVFRLGIGKSPQGESYRFLQTQPDLQFDAKDRSGSLAPIEPPDLAHVFRKIQGS